MTRETRSSSRLAPTATHVRQKHKNMNRTRRRSITTGGPGGEITITIPPNADYMVIENVGANEIRFIFDGDTFSNHWSIPVGKQSPVFGVNENKDIKVRAQGGASDIQYIFWG